MSYEVIVLGAGGHAKVLIDTLLSQGIVIRGITDPNLLKSKNQVLGIPVVGDDSVVLEFTNNMVRLINGLGSTRYTTMRQKLFEHFKSLGYTFTSIAHPTAVMGKEVELGEGAQVMAGCILQPGCKIGMNSIINTKASVDHDCVIGKHVHIAPGTTICGQVQIGDGVHVGTGTTIVQGVCVGKNSLIGAGSLVLHDVPEGATVWGSPARVVTI